MGLAGSWPAGGHFSVLLLDHSTDYEQPTLFPRSHGSQQPGLGVNPALAASDSHGSRRTRLFGTDPESTLSHLSQRVEVDGRWQSWF